MSQLSHRVASRFLAQSGIKLQSEETAGLFGPNPEEVRKQLEPLFQEVQRAAEARDAEAIGEYMSEIAKIYRQHPELQKEGRVLSTKIPSR